jgi:predicted Zn-dependent protease
MPCSRKVESTNARAILTASGVVMVQFDTKTIRDCNNNDQLAFLAAHEISHLIGRHAERTRGIPHSKLLEDMRFRDEWEADELGLMMAASAGYDERGVIEWMERSIRQTRTYEKKFPPTPIPPGHKTHPPVSRFRCEFDFCL